MLVIDDIPRTDRYVTSYRGLANDTGVVGGLRPLHFVGVRPIRRREHIHSRRSGAPSLIGHDRTVPLRAPERAARQVGV